MKNGSFLHSTAQKHRQAQVNVVHWEIFRCCGKRCILMVTDEGMITVNNFHGLQLNRKLSEPRVNVPQAESVKNYLLNFDGRLGRLKRTLRKNIYRYSRTVSSQLKQKSFV